MAAVPKNLTQKYRKVIIIGFGIYLSQVVYLDSCYKSKITITSVVTTGKTEFWMIMDVY